MSRRRARITPTLTRTEPDEVPVSARVAWSYLAALVSMVVAAGVVVFTNEVFSPMFCRASGDGAIADCKVGVAIWVSLAAFLLVLIPVALKAHLDGWFVATLWAELGLWVAFDAIDQWWWWAAVLLMPAAAAVASARWGSHPEVRRGQQIGIVGLLVAAVAALIWWYARG